MLLLIYNVSISYCNIFIGVGTVRFIPWAENSQNREFTHFRFHGAKIPVPWHSVPLLMTLRFQVYGSSVCGQMKNEKNGISKIKLLKIKLMPGERHISYISEISSNRLPEVIANHFAR